MEEQLSTNVKKTFCKKDIVKYSVISNEMLINGSWSMYLPYCPALIHFLTIQSHYIFFEHSIL